MDFSATLLGSPPKQAEEEHHGASYRSFLGSVNGPKQQTILPWQVEGFCVRRGKPKVLDCSSGDYFDRHTSWSRSTLLVNGARLNRLASACAHGKIVRDIIAQADMFGNLSVRDCNEKQEN